MSASDVEMSPFQKQGFDALLSRIAAVDARFPRDVEPEVLELCRAFYIQGTHDGAKETVRLYGAAREVPA